MTTLKELMDSALTHGVFEFKDNNLFKITSAFYFFNRYSTASGVELVIYDDDGKLLGRHSEQLLEFIDHSSNYHLVESIDQLPRALQQIARNMPQYSQQARRRHSPVQRGISGLSLVVAKLESTDKKRKKSRNTQTNPGPEEIDPAQEM